MAIIDPFAPKQKPESGIVDPFAPKVPIGIVDPFAPKQQVTSDTVVNPFAQEGVATAPEVEKSSLWEFPKRIVGGAIELKGMYAGAKQRQAALAMAAPEAAIQAFDKIDAGEIKDKAGLSKLIGGERKLPSAEEMLEGGGRPPGATVRAFGLAKDYLAASPEQRKALRAQLQAELTESGKAFGEAYELGQEAKRQAAPYEARVKSIFDAENTADVLSYFGGLSGQVLPQVVPMVAAGVLTRGRVIGPATVGAGMELGAGTQTRVDFIADKIKDEPDPNKRIKQISDYVQKTADVTLTAAIVNGALDAVLGPEKDIAKALLAQTLKEMTRKEIVKQIPKAAAKSVAQEGITGALQEIVQINAERKLGEQTGDAFTKENIKRVVDSALAEAIGGATITTGFQAGRAAFAKPGVKPGTPEAEAMAGLDALAAREEAATATKAAAEGKPVARTLEDLTEAEVDNIQRKLFAELGRPATYEELEGAFNDYLAEQNADRGIEPGADVAGVPSDRVAEAAGVPDTGLPPTPEAGGLADVGKPAESVAAGERVQPTTLEEATDAYEEAEAARDEAQREVTQLQDAIDEVGYEGSREDVAELNRMLTEAEARYKGARQAADAAFKNYTRLAEQELGISSEEVVTESTEGIPSEEDVAAAVPVAEEVIEEESSKPVFTPPEAAPRVDSIERFPLGPTSIKPTVVAEDKPLYRETNPSGVDDLLREDLQFGYAPVFVTDNPDLALGQGGNVGAMVEFRPNSVSGKVSPKPVPGEITGNEYQADVIAPRAIQSITFANQKAANKLSGFSKRALQQRFTKETLPDGRVKYTRKAEAKPVFAASDYTRRPEETEEEYRERLLMTPKSKMSADIVDRLRDNDLNGALQIIAKRFKSGPKIRTFYGELAERLAALNLPTEVRIGDQRNLTRRSIDDASGPQQVRLFSYLRTRQPQFFDEYFKNYDKVESLETVYLGLLELQKFDFQKILGPVINEYYDVVRAYKDNFVGISANGAYYTRFDILNLNDSVGRSNGMDYHTFLHEATHAATETLLNTPAELRTPEQNAAIEELRTLYNYTKERVLTGDYGLTNLSEFIAEVFTNKNFQDKLRNIPYAPARTNIFKKFIQTIARLFGMDNVAGRAMVEAEKLFSAERPLQTISAGPRFMAAKRKRKPAGPISTPDTYRTATDQQNMFLQTMKDAYEGRMQWKDAIKILGPALWDSKNTMLRGATLPVLNLTHLEDLTRTKFTQLTGALKIIRDMVAYRAKKMNTAGDIVKEWSKLQKKNFAQSQLMGRIMLEATIRGRDPDAGVPSGATPDALDKAWNSLKPEYKAIYQKVRNFYADSVNEMVREMKRRASSIQDPVARAEMIQKIDDQFGPGKLIGPYFPLRRFGQYWFQVGSGNFKEFYEFESPLARDVAMRRRIRELSAGNAQQKQLAQTISKGNGISELYGRNIGTTQVLKDVQELVDGVSATDVADLKGQLQDSLNQLIYLLLPQQSMRKMFINRKAIQGASADMLRVFATTAVHSAYQQSRFMFAEKFLQNLNNARSEIDDAQKMGMLSTDTAASYRDFILEVEKRVPTVMSNEDTSMTAKMAGKASELTFYYMLSAPFTAMLNTIGAVQLAMPYMGGAYGYAKSNAKLVQNMYRYLGTTPKRAFTPLARGAVAQVNFPSIVEGANLPPLLRRAADRFVDDGVIDISLTNDIFELGDRPSALYTGTAATIKKVMSGLFHQSERMNREIILLSTFELAYDKYSKDYQRQPGMEGLRGVYLRDAQGNRIKNTPDQAFELAIEEATRVASLTLGDYSRQMKGRIFANPIVNLLLKFKQYPILAMFAVYRNLQMGFIEPFKKAELDQYRALLEKELAGDPNKDQTIAQRMEEVEAQRKALSKEARRRLAGILGVSMILGGQVAMPYFSLVIGTLAKMFADDDDDDYFDWENWFYNYMETEFGGYLGAMLANAGVKPETAEKTGRTLGEIAARGVPSAMGAALADRISLDPKALLWRDGRFSPDAREDFIESIIANAGPVVGLGLNFVDAYQLAKDGQYGRAMEKALPAIISKPMAAIRMKEEGAKTKGGDVLVDDFTMTELAMQAIGLQPERLAQKQKAASAIKLKEQKIKAERAAIMDRLWMERDDPDAYAEQYDRAMEFSAKHPDLRIKPSQIRESFKKREKAARDAEAFGARIDKKLRGELRDMGEFAEDED